MDYYVNPSCFSSAYPVPCDLADKYLKLAKGEHIKVLLYMLRNTANTYDEQAVADACGVSVYDVKEALLFWADAGLLLPTSPKNIVEQAAKMGFNKIIKPTREDISKRGMEDPKIKWLLNQAQIIFGRNLRFNETQTLVWLYDDLGIESDVLFLIINHAKNIDRLKITYIQSLAVDWLNKGIDNIAAADEELQNMAGRDLAWSVVRSAFGIPSRKPSKKESDFSILWVEEWKISKDMLVAAYNVCIDNTGELSFPYIAKVIEAWHKNGYKSVDDIKEKSKEQKGHTTSYDLDLFEKMLNSKE